MEEEDGENTNGGLTFDIYSLSEFPSLSGGPQTQTPNTAQAIWGNANQQRTTQQNLVQRQPPIASQPPSRASQSQGPQPQPQTHASHDDLLPSGTQFAAQLDDFRNGGQGISGQLAGGSQPQPGSIEEFPPLGKDSAGEISQERRESLLQSSGLGSYGHGTVFSTVVCAFVAFFVNLKLLWTTSR